MIQSKGIIQPHYILQVLMRGLVGSILLLLTSCSGTKFLEKGEQLYAGSEITINTEYEIPDKKKLEDELQQVLRPQPTGSIIFGMRPTLWFYGVAGNPKYTGLGCWVKTNLGQPPVLWNQVNVERNVALLKNRLYNMGYFTADVSYDVNEKNSGKEVYIDYIVNIEYPYEFAKIHWPEGEDEIYQFIKEAAATAPLQEGKQYKLQTLKDAREAISEYLKNRGYYYFNPEYIMYEADSSVGGRSVEVWVSLKPIMPPQAKKRYKINDVYIYSDWMLTQDTATDKWDTLRSPPYFHIYRNLDYRLSPLVRVNHLEPGDFYSRKDHSLTLSQFMELGSFQFANIQFTEVDSTGEIGQLNAHIYLTQMLPKSIRAELEMTTKSNNFTGPGLNVSFRNRNLLGGAEMLVVSGGAGLESQFTEGPDYYNYTFTGQAELYIPRWILPFHLNERGRFLPQTKIELGFEFLKRINYYSMSSFNGAYGYIWNEDRYKTHELYPISLEYVNLQDVQPQFQEVLDSNYLFRRSFDDQFILGLDYIYTLDQSLNDPSKPIPFEHPWFFRVAFGTSGNIVYGITRLLKDAPPSTAVPYEIFGQPFSQFVRGEVDVRKYLKITENSKLATRLLVGVGVPYGNSTVLPYTEQFFLGGPNSFRAKRARTLGPGTFAVPEDVADEVFTEQNGDIKLLGNVEYRFPLVSIMRGALFVDAGNIWVLPKDTLEQPPGAIFQWNKFHQQIAVGAGVGLRADIQFFVIRADLAYPLRLPVPPAAPDPNPLQWFPKPFAIDNILLNIAIGYPF